MVVNYFVALYFEVQLEHSIKSFYINIVVENEELNSNSFNEFQDKVIKNYKTKHFSGFYVIESRILNISRV